MPELSASEINPILEFAFRRNDKKLFSFAKEEHIPHIDVDVKQFATEVPDYTELLQDRLLFKNELPGTKRDLARSVRSLFTQQNMVTLLIAGICIITFISFISSCAILNWFPGCRTHIQTEFYDLQVLRRLSENTSQQFETTNAKNVISTESNPQNFTKSRIEISNSQISSHYFNVELFKNLVLAYSLLLAFIRWHLANLQSGMSEIFERKRSVNSLIITNKSDIEDLISGALKFDKETRPVPETTKLTREACEAIIFRCAQKNLFGRKGPSLIQQMFVYIELDNLELALKKYKDGYLEDEQMYRACEIFESRCMTQYFRYLAVNQGLRNYTLSFHKLLVVLIIFGYHKGPLEEDDDPDPKVATA